MKIENINTIYHTTDMACVATLLLYVPLSSIDRTQGTKVLFGFKKSEELDRLLEAYWQSQLLVEPRAYFDSIKAVKTRLYEQI